MPAPCATPEEAVIAMSEAPALSKRSRGTRGSTGNRSNHHRYGEVKTRLTIGASADFALHNDMRAVIPRACGVSSTPRLPGSITDVSGILDRPPEPVIGRPFGRPVGGR